jgi:riboflavin kinase/FMN adenylyltransferase
MKVNDMIVYTDESSIEFDKNTVLTVGTFDGIHKGHEDILQEVISKAAQFNARSFVVTFEPHPRKVLSKENGIKLLTTLDEKKQFFEKNGIENLLIVNFTKEFSRLTSEEFIKNLICSKIGLTHMVVGYDHKFGRDRGGDENLLREIGSEFKFTVSTVGPVKINNDIISSSVIRKLIADGEMIKGNKFLGHNYTLTGTVVEGAKRGRTLGFPTANIGNIPSEKLIPRNGVYAVKINVEGNVFGGMMNIGFRPTFKDTPELILEVFIFEFDKNIYNMQIELEFLKYLRGEIKFSTKDELILQLNKDKEEAIKVLTN